MFKPVQLRYVLTVLCLMRVSGQTPGGLVVGNTDGNSVIKISPGQVTTLELAGVQTVLPFPSGATEAEVDAPAVPLPTTLAGFSATVFQDPSMFTAPLPIVRVRQVTLCDSGSISPGCLLTQLVVQIPNGVFLNNAAGPAVATRINVAVNGSTLVSVPVAMVLTTVHILTTCDAPVVGPSNNIACDPLITNNRGIRVGPFSGPAGGIVTPGETLVLYAFGLGSTTPPVPAGTASPDSAAIASGHFSVIVDFACPTKAIVAPLFVGLTPGEVGLYQVNFTAPTPITCIHQGGYAPSITLLNEDWFSSDTVAIYNY